eukprot:Ihof_evm5s436 gene=Ihof_evmTU5s436
MTTTKEVTCRYFQQRCCTKGSACPFSHDRAATKPTMVCRYYQSGHCNYGKACRYDHIRETPSVKEQPVPKAWTRPVVPSSPPPRGDQVQNTSGDEGTGQSKGLLYSQSVKVGLVDVLDIATAATILCPFAQAGTCRFGSTCTYLHGDPCPLCQRLCLHPNRPQDHQGHIDQCLAKQLKRQQLTEAIGASAGLECGICMEVVTEKKGTACRFGILSECDHIFCLGCIRQWRTETVASSVVRCCPICRVPSYYIVPSTTWPATLEEKEAVITGYKQSLGQKDCMHFQYGEGECPFGSSCFYRHAYRDGTLATPSLTVLGTADGTLQIQSKV